ncbi:gliding motility protein RemB [Ichthyenterobacterium magnum]|uniref:Protein involved in gliding motility RemB n=1 Tax=Ichthyenterobacterium magnum TaxID=1230530 RepID=A0A420DXZ0_9FLAO|nr:gliding motility protein RemB [Ichthyenterobacterium magnum]RKE99094.1 protein involved in gliding motility RemB [Ichthyenterobacterium magnum]
MKHILLLAYILFTSLLWSQNTETYERSPVFPECESQPIENLKTCFNNKLNQYIYNNFKVPQKVTDESYKGDVQILFEVDNEGKINVLYVDAVYEELKDEVKRVFSELPKVTPGTYNGRPIYFQYSLGIKIPLVDPAEIKDETEVKSNLTSKKVIDLNEVVSNEFDSINANTVKYQKLEYKSQLNIPFTHGYYARFDSQMNGLGTNSHTAAKPYMYDEVSKYYDFNAEKEALVKGTDSWWSRKLWNEHLVEIQGKDYWFTIDPILDLQVGKDTEADFGSTFNNTRGLYVQGGLGKKFNFSASVYESQGRFAQYFNQYAESLKAFGPDPAIIPGRGIAKRFKDDAYDYPVAEAYLSYTPAKFINVQFGHGKNFIGDGYRSLLQSDVASPYPFLKLNTKFWKIKYTNTWMWLKDVRPEATVDKAFLTKYMANHYLSWNVSKRLNVGLFESVIWTNTNDRGFDINYLNPIIFFRAIEFETGQGAGNAIVGASAKYKWNNKVNLYGQFVLDEFSIGDIKAGNKSWKNKFGYQLGVKYFNAFKVDNLLLQFEYNHVRPYTYSHNTIVLNYAHNNQSMAHLWGSNFKEAILIGRYNYKRWFGDAKFVVGQRGFDFNTPEDSFNYGGDIFRTEVDRVGDTNITVGQGNTTNVFHAELQAGYIINPVSNLKVFTNISYRNFNPDATTASTVKSNTTWFNIGVRTDLFNWYNDF